MYCSSCGSAATPGLSYCNRCGAELNAKKSPSTKESGLTESLVWAIVAVSVGGLGVLIGLMAVMKNELHLSNGMIFIFSLLTFALLLAAESVLIWFLLNSARQAKLREQGGSDTYQVMGSTTKELAETRQRYLAEPASVTEQTTRTLDPVSHESR
jgi:predicted amidophosphoribosyltransferase